MFQSNKCLRLQNVLPCLEFEYNSYTQAELSATCEFFSVTSQGCRLFTIDAEKTDPKIASDIIGGPRVCQTGYSYDQVLSTGDVVRGKCPHSWQIMPGIS